MKEPQAALTSERKIPPLFPPSIPILHGDFITKALSGWAERNEKKFYASSGLVFGRKAEEENRIEVQVVARN